MSFTEIIHWVALTTAVVVGAVYATLVRDATTVEQLTGALAVAMIVLTVAVVLLSVAVAVPMAIRSRGRLTDERDDAMEAGALPYTFSVLVIGTVWAAMDIITRSLQDRVMDPVVTVHILLGSLFLAVVTGSAVTVLRYRMAAR